MSQTAVVIITEAKYEDMDKVLGAMGEGYGGFENGVGLAAISDPTTRTHRLLNWAAASDDLSSELVGMASSQDAPNISPLLWGQNGTITIQDAQSAMSQLIVITYAGPSVNVTAWRNNELVGLGLTWWEAPE
jgi:hypothetical protein